MIGLLTFMRIVVCLLDEGKFLTLRLVQTTWKHALVDVDKMTLKYEPLTEYASFSFSNAKTSSFVSCL